jgi:type I restriction enzyme R subunit
MAGQQTRAEVQSAIRVTLNDLPLEPYPETLWNEKVGAVWDFVLQRYGANTSR